MRPGYYYPCSKVGRRRGVLDAVRRFVELYGCRPEHIGRIRVHRVNEMPIIHAFRGPVYVGPVPAAQVMAWPGCELWEPTDLFVVWVRNGGGQWKRQLNIDPLELMDMVDDYGPDYETWPSVLEIEG